MSGVLTVYIIMGSSGRRETDLSYAFIPQRRNSILLSNILPCLTEIPLARVGARRLGQFGPLKSLHQRLIGHGRIPLASVVTTGIKVRPGIRRPPRPQMDLFSLCSGAVRPSPRASIGPDQSRLTGWSHASRMGEAVANSLASSYCRDLAAGNLCDRTQHKAPTIGRDALPARSHCECFAKGDMMREECERGCRQRRHCHTS
jgi:hypothetical protein